MSIEQWLTLLIISTILLLFLWGKWRHDLVALVGLGLVLLFGLVNHDQAFTGFSHPATVTVALVLMLSKILSKSGSASALTKLIQPLTVTVLTALAAFLSAFMNNIGALALLMPVALDSAQKTNRSPSMVLMPLSFGSILGGLMTKIGTPPNMIVATYREDITGVPFSMFDFTPVGTLVTIGGILFISLIGWRLVIVRKKGKPQGHDLYNIEEYISEIKVTKESPLNGASYQEMSDFLAQFDAEYISLYRKNKIRRFTRASDPLQEGEMLLLEISPENIDKFITRMRVEIVGMGNMKKNFLRLDKTDLMEVIVSPTARIVGKTVEDIRLRWRYGVDLLAMARKGTPYRGRLRSFLFQPGDILLIHGEREKLPDIASRLGCIPLAQRGFSFGRARHAIPALLLFSVGIALAGFKIVPIHIALGISLISMILLRISPVEELYQDIDWSIIILLAAMIPIGSAVESTGLTEVIANTIIAVTRDLSVVTILAIILIFTMVVSDVLNNAATAILMAPLAKEVALQVGANTDTFLMAVAIGASCAFLTPIGHQNNMLIMGPGGYQFKDYWRLGLPLEIIILLIAMPTLITVWPL